VRGRSGRIHHKCAELSVHSILSLYSSHPFASTTENWAAPFSRVKRDTSCSVVPDRVDCSCLNVCSKGLDPDMPAHFSSIKLCWMIFEFPDVVYDGKGYSRAVVELELDQDHQGFRVCSPTQVRLNSAVDQRYGLTG
jgi:hypothetical protein